MKNIIKNAVIDGRSNYLAVTVVFEDGTQKELFHFYPDEISFSPREFIGLTEEEAYQLRRNRDIAYLQS